MRALEFLTGHVIFKLRYNQIYQLKTTDVLYRIVALLIWDTVRKDIVDYELFFISKVAHLIWYHFFANPMIGTISCHLCLKLFL